MAKMKEEYLITLGEMRRGMDYTARAYFFYATPTGLEMGMSKCPYIQILWSRGGNANELTGTRVSEMCFNISQPISLKMVCMHTGFGNPMNRKYLYLDLDPTAERIKVVGLGEFGEFIGRAKINAEKSELSMKTIRENFTINVLAEPTVASNKDTRSLIFIDHKEGA